MQGARRHFHPAKDLLFRQLLPITTNTVIVLTSLALTRHWPWEGILLGKIVFTMRVITQFSGFLSPPSLSILAPHCSSGPHYCLWPTHSLLIRCSSWGEEGSLKRCLLSRISKRFRSVTIPFPVLVSAKRSPGIG